MKIDLKSGYVFECDDLSFTETNELNGELIHIFISLKDRKKYTVNDDNIDYIKSDLSDEDLAELATYGEDNDNDDTDVSFG